VSHFAQTRPPPLARVPSLSVSDADDVMKALPAADIAWRSRNAVKSPTIGYNLMDKKYLGGKASDDVLSNRFGSLKSRSSTRSSPPGTRSTSPSDGDSLIDQRDISVNVCSA
jgi:hypothetical protein